MTLSIIEQEAPTCQDPNPKVGLLKLSSTPDESSPSPQSVAHHNCQPHNLNKTYYKRGIELEKRYGVPQTRRILTMGMFHKYHDEIRHQLTRLGLETKERDAIFKLLEFYIYYGKVYPKAADVADQAYISKRTYWRAINKLCGLGVIEVLNRFIKHRQISNWYRLDKLVLMLARLFAEHGHDIGSFGRKLLSFFTEFWRQVWDTDINLSLAAPIKLGLSGGGGW